MLKICIVLFLMAVCLLLKKAVSLIDRHFEKLAECILPKSHSECQSAIEWCNDGDRLLQWIVEHPLGATDDVLRNELIELQLNEIGSYMLFRLAHNKPAFDDWTRRKLEQIENWRT